MNRHVTIKEHARFYLDSSRLGRLWELVDSFVNLLFCINYVYMTLFSIGIRHGSHPPNPPNSLVVLDTLLAIGLLVIWFPNVCLSFDPYKTFTLQFYSHLSLLATIPTVIAYFLPDDQSLLQAHNLIFLYPFRFWRLHFSLIRNLSLDKNSFIILGRVSRKASELGLSIFSTLFTVTAWVHICLYRVQHYYDLSFFDVFYTITVSSTAGLATQIIPDNIFSRIITLYVMFVGAIFIPKNLADLLALIRSQSAYLVPFTPTIGCAHIVLLGSFQTESLRSFLIEYFCPDHGSMTLKSRVVLVSNQEPQEDLETFLKSPFYAQRVMYIRGSPLSFASMSKAKLDSALACFLFTHASDGTDPVQLDAELVMQGLAVRKYSKSIPIYAHALRLETRMSLLNITTEVLCMEEFKNAVVALNLLYPGFSTLIYLLTTSKPSRLIHDIRKKSRSLTQKWVHEYTEGMQNEIYAAPLSEKYAGFPFRDVAMQLYLKNHVLLFALRYYDPIVGSKYLVNPQDYVFQGAEMGYFIAKDYDEAFKAAENGPMFDSDPLFFQQDAETTSPTAPPDICSIDDLISLESRFSESKVQLYDDASEVVDANGTMMDHLIICNLSIVFPNLVSFLGPFRKSDTRSVVILSIAQPSPAQKNALMMFGSVYFVTGSSIHRSDLMRAGIYRASKAVILGKHEQNIDRAVDSLALLSVLNIQSICASRSAKIFIMVEFIYVTNIKFLGREEHHGDLEDDLISQLTIPTFASGQVFCKSIFHSTLCQAFYNPNLIDILRIIVYNGWIEDFGLAHMSESSGYIHQESIHQRLVNQSYQSLFTEMMKKGKLAIGLYRAPIPNIQSHWYVFINPPPETTINHLDLVFVFSKRR